MASRLTAFVIWAAVAASSVFWGLRLTSQPLAVPAHATVVATNGGANGNLDRLLGGEAVAAPAAMAMAQTPADTRFKLIGVVAPRVAAARTEGLALIALDDKPPRAYRVGAVVDGDTVLQAVHSRGASLGPRGQAAQFDLSLPALPPPATGVPASVGGLAMPAPATQGLPARPLPPPSVPQAEPALPPEAQGNDANRPPTQPPADRPIEAPPFSAGQGRPL